MSVGNDGNSEVHVFDGMIDAATLDEGGKESGRRRIRENNAARFSVCIPTTARVITTEDDILTGQIEPFMTMKITLEGDSANLEEAWEAGDKAIQDNTNIEEAENGPFIEVFVSGPQDTPNPSKWLTEIFIAINEI